jgi:UDP-N-acetylglucosamine 4,6-dehydratase
MAILTHSSQTADTSHGAQFAATDHWYPPRQKLHEIMCPADDSHLTLQFADHYVIKPTIQFTGHDNFAVNSVAETGRPVDSGFEYHSGRNPRFLGIEEIVALNHFAEAG